MDFFEQQSRARHKTKLLVVYFVLAVISMILMIYGVAMLTGLFFLSRHHHYVDNLAPFAFWNPQLFLGVTLGTLAVILIASAYKTMALSEGGSAVAESLGGRLV